MDSDLSGYINCILAVVLVFVFCVSSSRCRGLVCGLSFDIFWSSLFDFAIFLYIYLFPVTKTSVVPLLD